MKDTREVLLRTAERLFLERGIDAVSLREITSVAGANVASVNYHFGSKEELIAEVLRRRLVPINQRRLRLLKELRAGAPSGHPSAAGVLRAFIRPILEVSGTDGPEIARLMARVHLEHAATYRSLVLGFDGQASSTRFIDALREAFPALDEEQLSRGVDLLLGSVAYVLSGGVTRDLPPLTGTEVNRVTEELVAFLEGGLANLEAHQLRRTQKKRRA